jgi:pilus assembly protein Flp/PilA
VTLNRMSAFVRSFCRDESGPTATEYAVMLALIIVVSIATIGVFGNNVSTSVFGSVNAMFGS